MMTTILCTVLFGFYLSQAADINPLSISKLEEIDSQFDIYRTQIFEEIVKVNQTCNVNKNCSANEEIVDDLKEKMTQLKSKLQNLKGKCQKDLADLNEEKHEITEINEILKKKLNYTEHELLHAEEKLIREKRKTKKLKERLDTVVKEKNKLKESQNDRCRKLKLRKTMVEELKDDLNNKATQLENMKSIQDLQSRLLEYTKRNLIIRVHQLFHMENVYHDNIHLLKIMFKNIINKYANKLERAIRNQQMKMSVGYDGLQNLNTKLQSRIMSFIDMPVDLMLTNVTLRNYTTKTNEMLSVSSVDLNNTNISLNGSISVNLQNIDKKNNTGKNTVETIREKSDDSSEIKTSEESDAEVDMKNLYSGENNEESVSPNTENETVNDNEGTLLTNEKINEENINTKPTEAEPDIKNQQKSEEKITVEDQPQINAITETNANTELPQVTEKENEEEIKKNLEPSSDSDQIIKAKSEEIVTENPEPTSDDNQAMITENEKNIEMTTEPASNNNQVTGTENGEKLKDDLEQIKDSDLTTPSENGETNQMNVEQSSNENQSTTSMNEVTVEMSVTPSSDNNQDIATTNEDKSKENQEPKNDIEKTTPSENRENEKINEEPSSKQVE